MPAEHPFTDIEQRLVAPPASGVMLTMVMDSSPLAAAGARAGDIIVSIDGAEDAPDRQAFYQSMRAGPDGPEMRRYTVVGLDDSRRDLEVKLPLRGFSICVLSEPSSLMTKTASSLRT